MTKVLHHNKGHKHMEDQMLMSLHAANSKIIKMCNQELQAVKGEKNRKMLTSRVQPLSPTMNDPIDTF